MYQRIKMRCPLHTKSCTWTGNISDVSAHLHSCPCNVAAILKRAETAEETIVEMKQRIECLEFWEAENKSDVLFSYEFSPRKLQSLANKIGQCIKDDRKPAGGWNAVYAVIKQAHKDCK